MENQPFKRRSADGVEERGVACLSHGRFMHTRPGASARIRSGDCAGTALHAATLGCSAFFPSFTFLRSLPSGLSVRFVHMRLQGGARRLSNPHDRDTTRKNACAAESVERSMRDEETAMSASDDCARFVGVSDDGAFDRSAIALGLQARR